MGLGRRPAASEGGKGLGSGLGRGLISKQAKGSGYLLKIALGNFMGVDRWPAASEGGREGGAWLAGQGPSKPGQRQ